MTLRIRLFLLLFCLGSTTAFGQSITYDLPEGFNRDISKADYTLIVDSSVSIISRRYTIDLVRHGTVRR